MTSKQNSFRLGRLSHTSDFRKQSISEYNNPKETFKLAALTSITQGVKYNDLSFITGRQLPRLRKQPQDSGENLQYGAAHENLTSIRKKYDTVNKQKLQYESKINMLREQREKYKTIEDQYLSNKNQGNAKVKSMQDELGETKLNLEESEWNKKILQMLAERIKNDKVVYDQRKFNLEKELDHLKKQLKIFVKQGTGINQQTDRTAKVYEKLLKQLQTEEFQRQTHLQNLTNMINEKIIVNQSNEIRKNQIQEIAFKAMQDKDETEKNWINILHVNKFVDNLLRNKMSRQMDKFTVVELAFKNIKIATGVSDAHELIFKFLNKEQVYGQLLSKIADNQKRILRLKNQKNELQKQRKALKEENQHYLFVKKEQNQFYDQLKELEDVSQREVNAELNTERIRSWILRNFKKVYKIEKQNEDLVVGKTTSQLASSFKKYLQILSQEIDRCNQGDIKLEKFINQDEIRPDSKMFRVKPKTKKINHSGEEVQNQSEEQEIQNLNEEQDLIMNQRNEVIKQNQKFMKELKKKMDEIRKLRADAEHKKKSNSSPEKKASNVEQ